MNAIDKAFADHFTQEWIDAWNAHDLDRVLAHYTDDFEMSSPVITQIVGEPSGRLKGKQAIADYWRKALQTLPDLRFELIVTLIGAGSVTIHYKGARGRLAAEVFHFNADGKVHAAFAHYA